MLSRTQKLWDKQNQHEGDRWRFFRAVASEVSARSVLYPGSYVDVSASFVFPSVTYVDVDRRAAAFFGDAQGVREIIASHTASSGHERGSEPEFAFLHQDYTGDLGLTNGSFDLLVSLYAGFVSEACTEKLRIGGTLLVNSSHGDAAMASIDPRYRLSAAVVARAGDYRVVTSNLQAYLVGKKPQPVTKQHLHSTGRGIAYTTSAFAYMFERVG